jgi:hypothetical protein
MVNRNTYDKKTSSRVRRLLRAQDGKCTCGQKINAATLFETDAGLRCGSCIIRS